MAWWNRAIHILTLLVLAATAIAVVLMAMIAVDPVVPFNPYPPPTPSTAPAPLPGAAKRVTPTATTTPESAATPRLFSTPTPLRPATATPTTPPTMPFSFTVQPGPNPPLLNCRQPLIAGAVLDRAGEALLDYPVHLWGPSLDTIVRSGSDTRYGPSGWLVELPQGATDGPWYVQLHLFNIRRAHPPLSNIVELHLGEDCPQAFVQFREVP